MHHGQINSDFPNKILSYNNQNKSISENEFALEKFDILHKYSKDTCMKISFVACNTFIVRKCIKCLFLKLEAAIKLLKSITGEFASYPHFVCYTTHSHKIEYQQFNYFVVLYALPFCALKIIKYQQLYEIEPTCFWVIMK